MGDKLKNFPGFLKIFKKMTSVVIHEKTSTHKSITLSDEAIEKEVKPILNVKSPFIYLTEKEKEALLHQSEFVEYEGSVQEVLLPEQDRTYPCCIVIRGNVIVGHPKKQDSEVLSTGDSFGMDACLFSVVDYKVFTASENCVIMKIHRSDFEALLTPDKQFTVMLGSNLLNKQRIFAPIETFRNYVADCVESGEININILLKAYKAINSSIHPKRKQNDLDVNAWRYAVQRLPENLCSTYVYFISTTLPDMYNNELIINEVKTPVRLRMIYSLSPGKNYIILRELVSDLNDMLANLCIHVIESKKLRYKLRGPKVLARLLETKDLGTLPLSQEEKQGLVKMWGESAIEQVKSIMVHHEDYKISLFIPSSHLKLSPIELWTEQLWKTIREALNLHLSVVEAIDNGLIVDFMQGSTRSILNAISPYIIKNQKMIVKWFEESGITLKTSDLHDPRDKIIAMSYYFFQAHPEEKEKREKMDKDAGIIVQQETHNTGVRVIVVNIAKLSKYNKDFNPKSKFHILLYIGFTFGKQSYDIIKSINHLLGKALVSYTVVGKAGGLGGYRNDILVATRFFDEVSKNVIRANYSGISQSLLQKETDSLVRIGPMLTVSGTILQNTKMLLYYKHIEGCIGLEMEGACIALCIKHSIEAGIIREDVSTRFIYYVADLPLNPDTSMVSEEDNFNFDEGVKSINGINRYIIGLINKQVVEDINSEMQVKLTSLCRSQEKIVVIGTTTESINILNQNVASELAELLLAHKYTVVYLTPEDGITPFMRKISQSYLETNEFVPEDVAKDLRKQSKYKEKNKLMIIEYTSYSDYINKLHCVAETAQEGQVIPFLFADTQGTQEVLNSLNGSQLIKIKSEYETLKIECPKSILIFFRTDLDNGVVDQNKLLVSYHFDYIFTRYKEMNKVDIVSSEFKEQISAEFPEVIRKILKILDSIVEEHSGRSFY